MPPARARRSIARLLLSVTLAVYLFSDAWTTASSAALAMIMPGEVWRDTSGNIIQAHGAGMIQLGNTYYWFGEDHTGATNDQSFHNIKCYSSTDLTHWTFRKDVLTRQTSGDLGLKRVVERPKVIYNEQTDLYVMYMHIDDITYAEAKVGRATSTEVCGTYEYLGSFRPLGNQSRDFTLFKDTDSTAYLIHEDRAAGVRILRLSNDYLTIDREITLIQAPMESPAILKKDGTYFLLGSNLTGWNPNPNKYTKAQSLAGPWAPYEDIAPPSTNTHASQTAYILTVAGRLTTSYMYVGDRWFGNNLGDSRYIWLPLRIDATSLSLTWCDSWAIDTGTGELSDSCNPYPNQFNFYLPRIF